MIPTFKDRPQFDTRNPKPCIVATGMGSHKHKNYLCIPMKIVNVAMPGTPPILRINYTERRCDQNGRIIERVRMSKKQRLAIRRQREGVLP